MTTTYPCLVVHSSTMRAGGGSCAGGAVYFAIDNRVKYGHVCRFCWRALSYSERALYSEEST